MMKKVLSVLVAVVLCLSLGVFASAADIDLGGVGEDVSLFLDQASAYTPEDAMDVLSNVDSGDIEEALAAIGSPDLASLSELNTGAIPGFLDQIFDQLSSLGLPVDAIKQAMSDSEILNFLASIYIGNNTTTTEATTEETTEETTLTIPETGNNGSPVSAVGGLAVLAAVSLAAAAYFISNKKKA